MIATTQRDELAERIARYTQSSKVFRMAGRWAEALSYANQAVVLKRQLDELTPVAVTAPADYDALDESTLAEFDEACDYEHTAEEDLEAAQPEVAGHDSSGTVDGHPVIPEGEQNSFTVGSDTADGQHGDDAALSGGAYPVAVLAAPSVAKDAPAPMDSDPEPLLADTTADFDDEFWDTDTSAIQEDPLALLDDYDPDANFDADEFDEALRAPTAPVVQKGGKVARHARAREVAFVLGDRYGWEEHGIDIMAQVFTCYYWSSAQRAMVRELEAGLTPEELRVALVARGVWEQCAQFHVSLFPTTLYERDHPALGWRVAVALARALEPDAGEDDVYEFLAEALDAWRTSPAEMREYPEFHSYLAYSLGLAGDVISAPLSWSFVPTRSEDN